jgi:hypothetical protein
VKIHAVTVCVDYADFLAESLPLNLPHLDSLTVVTTARCIETLEVCSRHGVATHVTDSFFRKGNPFNKGLALNEAISGMDDGKLLFLDADTILPRDFRSDMEKRGHERDSILGCDRMKVIGREQLDLLKEGDEITRFASSLSDRFPIIERHIHENRPLPIGFFQMVDFGFIRERKIKNPEDCPDASWSDVQFAIKFPRRPFLEGCRVFHLQSGQDALGTNWKGRISRRFI